MSDQFIVTGSSFLVADCGNANTSLMLFDVVEGGYRLISRVVVPSTLGAPWFNVARGVEQATRQMEKMIGRMLLTEKGTLITPVRDNGSGVDFFTAVVSAAPPLEALLVGIFDDVSLASARRALHTTYTKEVDHFSLADNRQEQGQIEAIVQKKPDVILIVGGTDGGESSRVLKMVDTVGIAVDIAAKTKSIEIIYAGNSHLQTAVEEIIGSGIILHKAPNVRPRLEMENVSETARILGELYQSLKIKEIPGAEELKEWSKEDLKPTAQMFATMCEYIANLHEGPVLGIDVGAQSVTLISAQTGLLDLTIHTDLGTGRHISHLLQKIDLAQLIKWVPSAVNEKMARDFIANLALQPQTIAVTDTELHLEQAIVREMLQWVVRETAVRWGWQKQNLKGGLVPPIKSIVARGAVFANAPRLGQVVFMLLDALQPTGIVSIYLDQLGLLPALGALSSYEPIVPVQMVETDALLNLGCVVSPTGRGKKGDKVLDVVVKTAQGQRLSNEVIYGTLEVISVSPGEVAQVTLTPTNRFDIGFGLGREHKLSLKMGAVGLIIDARGRPLQLPKDQVARQSLIRQWLWDMGG